MDRWLVTCSGNHKAQSDVVSPIKPKFCPMCGLEAKVMEWNAPDKFRAILAGREFESRVLENVAKHIKGGT